jgi:hypothetical protein
VGDGLLVEELTGECAINILVHEADKVLSALTNHPRLQFYLRQSISKDSVGICILETQRESLGQLRAELLAVHKARI